MKKLGRRMLEFLEDLVWKVPAFRKRLLFAVRRHHFQDLDFLIPFGQGLQIPVYSEEYLHSFSEVFLERSYEWVFLHMPLPKTWIDLGCHAGYFSIDLLRRIRASHGGEVRALLLDADPRSCGPIERLIRVNNLEGKLRFLSGAICSGKELTRFCQRLTMDSSCFESVGPENRISVPIVHEERILEWLPAELNLLKVDIEGGEFDLVVGYPRLIQRADWIVIEWHTVPGIENPRERLLESLTRVGFTLRDERRELQRTPDSGVFLFQKGSRRE